MKANISIVLIMDLAGEAGYELIPKRPPVKKKLRKDGWPRRADTLLNTPAELAIRDAMIAVEGVGAHPLLTDAVTLLAKARERLADYIDLQE